MFSYRALIASLALRDLRVTYSQTILGIFWAFIKPICFLMVYSFFFTYIVKVDTQGVPYVLIALTGLMGWGFFRYAVDVAGNSLVTDAELIKKNAFPRLVVPLYRSLGGITEFLASLVILFILLIIHDFPLRGSLCLIPILLVLNLVVGLAVALWTSVLSVRIRDLYHFVSAVIAFAVWLTPVFYGASLVPEQFRFLLYINPMAGIIACYRWAALGIEFPSIYYCIGFCMALILFLTGVRAFVALQSEVTDYL